MLSFDFEVGQYILVDVSLIAVNDWVLAGDDFGEIGVEGVGMVGVEDGIFFGGEGVLYFEVAFGLRVVQEEVHYLLDKKY